MRGLPPFDWITAGLAVGGCFAPRPAEEIAALGVGAVVDLRAESCDDREALERCGLLFLHLPTADLEAVSQPMLDAGVAFAAYAGREGRRVLVHCQHGVGRSALLALCVMVSRGWTPKAALARAKDARWQVSPNPDQYEAWVAWLRRRRCERGEAWTVPHFEAFAAVAYRHLPAP